GSIAIGMLLVVIALVLATEMKRLLIGEAASDSDVAEITRALGSAPDVNSIIHLRTVHLGPDDLLVAAKVDFDHSLSVEELAGAIDRAEQALRAAVAKNTIVYIEPDIQRRSS
ncbi:MAG TPA: cation transporter dimerization domain-containing protein, partial [Ilumatobacteraceae bacterium]|nr:cation transporter dimerization domain-containing protein [Ilumatobacteraceae bacterium]